MRFPAFLLASLPVLAHALGEPVNGFPKWEERVIHAWTNRARSDPAFEMAACTAQFGAARCGEQACYTPQAPLAHNLGLGRASRFHSDEMRLQGYFNHPSLCNVVANIDALYPDTCNGAAACACTAGAPTDTFQRIARFGVNGTGEIIASSQDPNTAFYQWLHEPASDPACVFTQANGHRFLILTQAGSMGAGVSGPSVAAFGPGAAPAKIPSGSHYPRQSSSVEVWANWFDAAGPSVARVNVGGSCTAMTRQRGTLGNGAWRAVLGNVASGCHRYYVEFKDSGGNPVTFPTTGSLGIGPAGSCPDWDAARPVSCDAVPMTPPGAPALTGAAPGNGQVTLTFLPPAGNGGSPVTGYSAQCLGTPTVVQAGAASPIVVTGLANGNAYDCAVQAINAVGSGPFSGRLFATPNTGTPLALTGVRSRKQHAMGPVREAAIDPASPASGAGAVESRAGPTHVVVFQFSAAIFSAGTVAAVDSVAGALPAGVAVAGNEVAVSLAGVADNRRVTVSLTNVNGAGVNARAVVGFLVGDVDASGVVTAADLAFIKHPAVAGAGNFRADIDLSGVVDVADLAAARARAGRALP